MPRRANGLRVVMTIMTFLMLINHITVHRLFPLHAATLEPQRIQSVPAPFRTLPPADLYGELYGTQYFEHFVGVNSNVYHYLLDEMEYWIESPRNIYFEYDDTNIHRIAPATNPHPSYPRSIYAHIPICSLIVICHRKRASDSGLVVLSLSLQSSLPVCSLLIVCFHE